MLHIIRQLLPQNHRVTEFSSRIKVNERDIGDIFLLNTQATLLLYKYTGNQELHHIVYTTYKCQISTSVVGKKVYNVYLISILY